MDDVSPTGLPAEQPPNVKGWPDRRLIDAYRRHSEVLIHYGFDLNLAHRMGRIEEELRERDIDPDEIVRELWDQSLEDS